MADLEESTPLRFSRRKAIHKGASGCDATEAAGEKTESGRRAKTEERSSQSSSGRQTQSCKVWDRCAVVGAEELRRPLGPRHCTVLCSHLLAALSTGSDIKGWSWPRKPGRRSARRRGEFTPTEARVRREAKAQAIVLFADVGKHVVALTFVPARRVRCATIPSRHGR